MASRTELTCPSGLYLSSCLDYAKQLKAAPVADHYHFDFGSFCSNGHAPPFGMLFVARCVKQFYESRVSANPDAKFTIRKTTHSYAEHMGFWKHMGVKAHAQDQDALGSDTYRPISALKVKDLNAITKEKALSLAQVIDAIALEQAEILTRGTYNAAQNTLQYCLRELFRNIAEHSNANTIWYCTQYWPQKGQVELAVLDEGRGIRESLLEHPSHQYASEKEAIIASTQSGVTRTGHVNDHHPAMWPGYGATERQNAGFGLYVLKLLCERAGSMTIVSNGQCVEFELNQTRLYPSPLAFSGTAIRVFLKPEKLDELLAAVLDRVSDGKAPSALTPSLLASI